MDKRTAKRQSLKVWKYLSEHPEIKRKENLPEKLYNIIVRLPGQCPLCAYFKKDFKSGGCDKCILNRCYIPNGLYSIWYMSKTNNIRKSAALAIYNKIKEWEVK